ncbi:ATP-dependent helicase/nuclease subunit A [compost metagenome]
MSSTTLELKNVVLRAGAGAGKTTTLTETFLRFASDFKTTHNKFPRIVVTTFTRKATQELKERLLKKSLEDGREDLFHYVSSKANVQISTIHGVLSLFLARYGSMIGLTPDYKILSESEIRKGARKIMRKYILENPRLQELLEEYEFSALESALLEYFSQSLIFGEMKFITEDELKAETTKLVKEVSQKLKNICSLIVTETSNDKWQDYARSLGSLSWNVDGEDYEALFDRISAFFEGNKKPSYLKKNPPFTETLNEEFEEIRDRVKDLLDEPRYRPSFWRRHQENCELFDELAQSFSKDFLKLKLEVGQLSMSDLETLAYKIMKDSPDAAAKFSLEWDFWMIDEYQDTSPIQVNLLRALVGDKPFFVVGDPQQSIYLFRGARSEVFQEKVDEVQAQDGDVQVKLVNYRSNPEVLEFFNHYFTSLGPQFAAMTPDPKKEKKGNGTPVVQVVVTETAKEDDESQEVLSTVARIQELLQDGLSPEKICVLGRTHRTLENIAKVAQSYGVPLQLHSGSGFYERREVLDALALLKFLVNPHDNYNFLSLLRSPWLVLSDDEIVTYCHSFKHSYWKEAAKTIDSLPENHPVRTLKMLLGLAEDMGLSWTLKKALVELGVFDYSARIDSTGRREANLWKVVSLLSQEERRPGFNFLDFLDSNLEELSTDEGGEDSDATPVIEPKRVNFMTVHASKGLQFDHVILPGMGQDPRNSSSPFLSIHEKSGQWTLKVRNEETQSMTASQLADQIVEELKVREGEEFNRVLYVALTRAKAGVTLLWDHEPGKRSWAAKCPLNLEEGLHEEKDFSYIVRKDNLSPEKMNIQALEQKDVREAWKAPQGKEKMKHVSVTELVAPTAMMTQMNSPGVHQLLAGLGRAQQGTNAHRLFESLKFSSYEDLLSIAEDDFKKPLEFVSSTKEIPLLRVIQEGHVEWGFALKKDDSLLQGQIDLWGIVDGVAWIVDYKTGSQKYSDVAFAQLEVYAQALSQMGYLSDAKEISLAVVYPMDEKIKIKKAAF